MPKGQLRLSGKFKEFFQNVMRKASDVFDRHKRQREESKAELEQMRKTSQRSGDELREHKVAVAEIIQTAGAVPGEITTAKIEVEQAKAAASKAGSGGAGK